MKAIIILLSAILLASCNQNSNTNQQPSPAVPILVYGGSLYATTSASQGGSSSASYMATFYDSGNNLVSAGTVKANGVSVPISVTSNHYVLYQSNSSIQSITTWSVTGNSANNISEFNISGPAASFVPMFTPDTIIKSQAYTLDHAIIHADSIRYQLGSATFVRKIVTGSSASVTFTPAEMAFINLYGATYSTVNISIEAWNVNKETVGAKYYNFVTKTALSCQAVVKEN